MTKRQVFYSFHYANDVMRAHQVRNIGVIEGNRIASPNEWEAIKRSGNVAIKRWIDENMKYKSCVIVLIGTETSSRPWVKYEIEKAWNDGKGLMGIYIHNLRDPRTGTCRKGINPFTLFKLGDKRLSDVVPCHNPNARDAYSNIRENLVRWIEDAISIRKQY